MDKGIKETLLKPPVKALIEHMRTQIKTLHSNCPRRNCKTFFWPEAEDKKDPYGQLMLLRFYVKYRSIHATSVFTALHCAPDWPSREVTAEYLSMRKFHAGYIELPRASRKPRLVASPPATYATLGQAKVFRQDPNDPRKPAPNFCRVCYQGKSLL